MSLLFKQAQQGNLLYPSYVWILHSWNASELSMSDTDCSSYNMAEILEGAIGISHTPSFNPAAFKGLVSTNPFLPLHYGHYLLH